ncbi:prepilin-type N-terminal cleavage/methylation domain-containing protein [Trichlorobacter thiogenes]|uniref:Prepilin-type N-terminal cleavage/methylation domain-containing protein n=1 Tax=Trichlorobacter thiogenes TaxID=115783 RepID=A0A1T4SAR8_9BACT|nr:prepilin-type N-terminal cleavage/methylation domain-containing protein [Trichlorobacter thiogenes]SKA25344.1 prepilin-type N-terminal cleavage/methylation domain-containing protein [Trichlorobacter thiogenes]
MSKLNNSKGFTLVELLVAITLMAIGILAIVQMQIVGMKSGTIAQRQTVATNIVREVMEDIQSWEKDALIADVAVAPVPAVPPSAAVFPVPVNDKLVTFLTDPRVATSRDRNILSFPDSGTFRAFYAITLAGNVATIIVRVEQRRADGQFEERVRMTGMKDVS